MLFRLSAERARKTEKRDTVFASDDPEDLTLLPIKPFKQLGARVVSLTHQEHVALNPPTKTDSFQQGSDTQLFRDAPQTISQVFADWDAFAKPAEKTRAGVNWAEFDAQLMEYVRVYNALIAADRMEEAIPLKYDIDLLRASARAALPNDDSSEHADILSAVDNALKLAA